MAHRNVPYPIPVLSGPSASGGQKLVRDLGVVIMLTSGTLSCSLLEARGLTVFSSSSRGGLPYRWQRSWHFLLPQSRGPRQPGTSYFTGISPVFRRPSDNDSCNFPEIFSTGHLARSSSAPLHTCLIFGHVTEIHTVRLYPKGVFPQDRIRSVGLGSNPVRYFG